MGPEDDNIRPTGVSTYHDTKTTGVEDQTTSLQPEPEIDDSNKTERQYEYINLQGVFGDILSNKTIPKKS